MVGKRGLPVRAAPDSLAAKVGMLRAGASCTYRRQRRLQPDGEGGWKSDSELWVELVRPVCFVWRITNETYRAAWK